MYLALIEMMGAGGLQEQQLKQLVDILKEALDEYFDKQSQRQEQRKDEHFDKVLEETLCDKDRDILGYISSIMHSLFEVHKTAILPVFEQLLPLFAKLLVSVIAISFLC